MFLNTLIEDLNTLIMILVCILFSMFFSGAETAITALGTLKAKHLLEQGPLKDKKYLSLWINYPSYILTTILVLNNVCNILASSLTTAIAIKYFGNYAVGIATGILTFVILLFGEIIPKSLVKVYSDFLALPLLKIIYYLYFLIYPVVFVFAKIANFIINISNANISSSRVMITEEELEFMIEQGSAVGVIEKIKKDMISSVFEFDEIIVREIMTPRTDVVFLDSNHTIEYALKVFAKSGHSRIPVCESNLDNVIGILFAKDLLAYIGQNHCDITQTKVSSIIRSPFFVPESKLIMNVFKDLKRTKNHMAIVIDEYGGTAGIVTMEDILEEIVGDIQDEFDKEEAEIIKISDGIYDVSGTMNIEKFFEFFDVDLSLVDNLESGVDTMGGLLMQLLGEMPKVGQGTTLGPFSFKVVEIERHRIKRFRVKVELPQNQEQLNNNNVSEFIAF